MPVILRNYFPAVVFCISDHTQSVNLPNQWRQKFAKRQICPSLAGENWLDTLATFRHYFLGEHKMKLNPPKMMTFYISLVLAVLGVVWKLFSISFLAGAGFWFLLIGFIVLVAGLLVKGF